MNTFNKYKILHGLPNIGQKITFINPTKSWFTNVEEDTKLLVPGKEYTVRKTELNSSSTYVWLEEFPNIFDNNDPMDGRDQPFFNMSSFHWISPEVNLQDLIGFNAIEVRRLAVLHQWGFKIKDKVMWDNGNPMLVVDHDDRERVIKAKLI